MNIIVTGASRGIGYELVKLFAASAGNKVIAVARNAEKLEALKKDCAALQLPAEVIAIPSDLGNAGQLSALSEQIRSHVDSVDVLINNAGAIVNKPFPELTAADFEYVYKVNVFAVAALIQKVIPVMNAGQRSHIVNISSMGGFQGSAKFAGLSAYSSSKAALACLTECLAEEFRDSNIAFNCLALGAAQTEMLSEAFPGYKAPVSAVQMAQFIADFALKAHHFMNGKIIPLSMSTP
ncbi:MAG: dehydrogenase, short-chain alcohol dehydrogenase like protein [Bacteroidetes bacterium]|nr:dehydrogenase, short-chain alcohol dehydrogenase like protein [Bacteroidota bacterium]